MQQGCCVTFLNSTGMPVLENTHAIPDMQVSYDGGKLLRLPKEVHFVTPEYVSECLAHGQLQPEREFLIDIVRMAVLATGQQVSVAALL